MKGFIWFIALLILAGCANDELSWISIRNDTTIPIYVQPYSSEFTNSDWIPPGVTNDFYSINCDCIDGFSYFSFYYDSLIIQLKDHEEETIKFYKDGTTLNYAPEMNPFINKDVWEIRDIDRPVSGTAFNSVEEKHIIEHYFRIKEAYVKSLSVDTESDPLP